MLPVANESKSKLAPPPNVLVVEDEPGVAEVISDIVRQGVERCKVIVASNLAEARAILSKGSIEVMVTDVHLPDGDGFALLNQLREQQPCATAIIMTGNPSVDRAIKAMRGGAVDFMSKPFSNQQLIDRIKAAIERAGVRAKRERRVDKLRDAVKRLNNSRKMISKKVDLLCNDLVSAYGELSRQLEDVRNQDGFRKYIDKAKDLEQLLCHSMDWLLREMGYCNVAVFLASDEGVFQLGAYMKYTVAGETLVTEALRRVLVPLASKESMVKVGAKSLADKFTPQEMALFKGQEFLAVNCTYLGESLASLVFFREEKSAFTDADGDLLRQISPIFAVELASCVRDETTSDTALSDSDSDGGGVEDPPSHKKPRPKKDPADWWKNGEPPPF